MLPFELTYNTSCASMCRVNHLLRSLMSRLDALPWFYETRQFVTSAPHQRVACANTLEFWSMRHDDLRQDSEGL